MTNKDDDRARLEQLRDELVSRRERVSAHGREGVPADFAEQVTARENDDVVAALGAQIEDELRQVNLALARLAKGSYEVCSRCGDAIGRARLEALPFTEFCVNCAA